MRLLLRICDYLFVLRPLLLIPTWSFFLLGAAAASRDAEWAWSPRLIALTCINVFAHLINQLFDRQSDERNRKCFYLWQGIFRPRTLVVLATVFVLAAALAFEDVSADARPLLITLLVLSVVYSMPPLRLCARPFADLLVNALGYGWLSFLLGYGTAGMPWTAMLAQPAPWVLLVAAVFVHTTIPDINGDRETGKISTAVLLGPRWAAALATVFNVLALIAALALKDTTALVAAAVSAPIAVYAAMRRGAAASSLYVQLTSLIVAGVTAFLWPVFAAVVLPIVALSRFYHRRRFDITYPGRREPA